jgi:hypothetical protein
MHRRGHAEINVGMYLDKPAEPMHEPFGGKIGDVLTVKTPEVWRWTRRSVPTAIRSSASRITAR